jgi:hypothetical protein
MRYHKMVKVEESKNRNTNSKQPVVIAGIIKHL